MGNTYGNYSARRARNTKVRKEIHNNFWEITIIGVIILVVIYLLLIIGAIVGIALGINFLNEKYVLRKMPDWKFWIINILMIAIAETLFLALIL